MFFFIFADENDSRGGNTAYDDVQEVS